ncbi:MAG: class I SAM-dependent methyltransferase [Planctomycetota bacterium]
MASGALWALPSLDAREGYYPGREHDYWLSGLFDAWRAKRSCLALAPQFGRGPRVVDLGAASGRVARHVPRVFETRECWAIDIDQRHIDWISTHLGGAGVRAVQIPPRPSLPLASGSVDLVTAFSVFTHIDSFETAWIAEIERVLSPGGVAYLSIHSERTWQDLNPEWALWSALLDRPAWSVHGKATRDLFASPMPAPRVSFTWQDHGDYRANVFYSTDYITHAWGSILPVKSILPREHDYQDVVVMQKKS